MVDGVGGNPGVATLCDNDVTCLNNLLNVLFEFVVTKTLKNKKPPETRYEKKGAH